MSSPPGKMMSLDKTDQSVQMLINQAVKAREFAYVPYSKFKVGCALLTPSGKVFTGCNVENSSIGVTVCAERTTIAKAVSEGYKEFERIAIATDRDGPSPTVTPCGACRQFIHEFSVKSDIPVYCFDIGSKKVLEITISELLPWGFRLNE